MPYLDHIIILVPYAHLASAPRWITDNFTLTPGGQHADNKTANNLICFQDGSYIELIAFINDDHKLREGHWWGKKKFGIIDFAFTHREGDALVHYLELEQRLQNLNSDLVPTVEYQKPVEGGRQRLDGVDVKWKVTFPLVDAGYQRGELPFFCHDVTNRELRVPLDAKNTRHPNGAHGVRQLEVFVPREKVQGIVKAYGAIFGEKADSEGLFALEKLNEVVGAGPTVFRVQAPMEEWQKKAVTDGGGLALGPLTVETKSGKEEVERLDGDDGAIGHFFLYGI